MRACGHLPAASSVPRAYLHARDTVCTDASQRCLNGTTNKYPFVACQGCNPIGNLVTAVVVCTTLLSRTMVSPQMHSVSTVPSNCDSDRHAASCDIHRAGAWVAPTWSLLGWRSIPVHFHWAPTAVVARREVRWRRGCRHHARCMHVVAAPADTLVLLAGTGAVGLGTPGTHRTSAVVADAARTMAAWAEAALVQGTLRRAASMDTHGLGGRWSGLVRLHARMERTRLQLATVRVWVVARDVCPTVGSVDADSIADSAADSTAGCTADCLPGFLERRTGGHHRTLVPSLVVARAQHGNAAACPCVRLREHA
eukprot:m.1157743 g.1157743  ORF g.1157743 m.1157743 type:complete len:311 (+) comp24498_c0_seq10:2341-3273(+)